MPEKSKPIPRTLAAILVIGVIIVAGAAAFLLIPPSESSSGEVKVVASFYPLYYLASEVAGERAEVSMLIPDNAEPHSWEPSPSDIIKVSEADVLVYNGVGFEPWMEDLLAATDNPGLELVDTSQGVSLLPSESVVEAYEEGTALLASGPNRSVPASPAAEGAQYVNAMPMVLQVALADMAGGKGGFLKINVTLAGDYRLLSTNDVNYALYHLNGTEVAAEMANGAITWYPQFASSLFVELEVGTYLLGFGPGSSSEAELVIVQSPGHEGEEHEHGSQDPHFWLDPVSAKAQVGAILEALQRADPGNATYFAQNAADLNARLDQLHLDYQEGLHNRTKNAIITTHEGFNYLAFRYGFEAYGAIGISADQQPSPQDLADLVGLIEDLGLNFVYSEPVYSDAVMETIAMETGAGILVLDGLHGRTGVHADLDYFSIMYANLESLKTGLEVTS